MYYSIGNQLISWLSLKMKALVNDVQKNNCKKVNPSTGISRLLDQAVMQGCIRPKVVLKEWEIGREEEKNKIRD